MFEYTKSYEVDSSVIDSLFYNDTDRELLVRLHGDKQYLYSNVARNEVEDIAYSTSPGRAYNNFRYTAPSPGVPVHDDAVAPKNDPVSTGVRDATWAVNVTSNYFSPTPVNDLPSDGSQFLVTYNLLGQEYNSTVDAVSVVSAAEDVAGKLQSLGLNPVVTAVTLVD